MVVLILCSPLIVLGIIVFAAVLLVMLFIGILNVIRVAGWGLIKLVARILVHPVRFVQKPEPVLMKTFSWLVEPGGISD